MFFMLTEIFNAWVDDGRLPNLNALTRWQAHVLAPAPSPSKRERESCLWWATFAVENIFLSWKTTDVQRCSVVLSLEDIATVCHGNAFLAAVSSNTNANGLLLRLLLIVPVRRKTGHWQVAVNRHYLSWPPMAFLYCQASLIRMKRSRWLALSVSKEGDRKKEEKKDRKKERERGV